jgi:hypothetical protein
MDALRAAQAVAVAGLVVGTGGLVVQWRATVRLAVPPDRAPPRGEVARGVLYAFTAGMAPSAKESTRLHRWAYLRGLGFHAAVFGAVLAVAAWPLWPAVPPVVRGGWAAALALGAVLAGLGTVMRLREPALRSLSTPDDHAAVGLVTAFLAATAAALWTPAAAPAMFVVAGILAAYIPFGKIRHCLYFFPARRAFGRFVGRRGVLPHLAPHTGARP